MTEQIYFSQKELANRWRCSSTAVGDYRDKGLIPAVRLPESNRYIYPVSEILDYERRHRKHTTVEEPVSLLKKGYRS
jgi:predicted site-specific integrase-resolvase